MRGPANPENGVDVEAATDEQLLRLFVRQRHEDAFAELVRRHAALVWSVCRRMLVDANDADDAFQATFLVLAMRAAQLRRPEALSAWLYGVAFRTARRLAGARHREHATTVPLMADLGSDDDPLVELTDRHDRQVVDEELNRLPARYREPLVLHYLLGQTQQEIADALGESVAAIDGRMKRGRRRLRIRLTARGVSVAGGLAAVALVKTAAESASPALIAATTSAAQSLVAGAATTNVAVTTSVQLARQELAAMTLVSTTKTLAAIAAGCAVLLGLAGAAALYAGSPQAGAASSIQIQAGASAAPDAEAALLQLAQADTPAEPAVAEDRQAAKEQAEEMRKWMTVDYRRQSPEEQRVRAQLETETRLEFIETPLADVVSYLQDLHQIKVQLDMKALDAAGIASDTPITQELVGVSLRSGLRLMLGDLGLSYIVRNGVLQITTLEVAEAFVETRVYELRRLAGVDGDRLVAAIRATIRPPSWSRDGDTDPRRRGRIMAVNGALVVTQSQQVHEQIVDLLAQLDNHADNPLYQAASEE